MNKRRLKLNKYEIILFFFLKELIVRSFDNRRAAEY